MARPPRKFRAARDFIIPSDESTLEEIAKSYSDFLGYFNSFNKLFSLEDNFNSFIEKDIEFAASEEKTIQHFLGVVPKYRIILRQVGNGVIEDIPSGWTDKVVSFKNRGTETVKITLMIVRE